jgi:chromosome segregation ATPase
MARERGFTDEQIIAAATQLTTAGKKINGSSLRAIVGIGRTENLIEAYQNLMENGAIQAITEVVDVEQETMRHLDLPPQIAEQKSIMLADIDCMVSKINDLAHHTVEQRLNSAINQANKLASDAAINVADSEVAQATAFNQVEDMREVLNKLKDEHENLKFQQTQLKSDLEVSSSETKSAEKTITERTQRISEVEKQLMDAQKQLKAAETGLAKADGRVEAKTSSLDAKTAEYKDLKLEFSTLQNNFNAISVREAELRTHNQHQSTDISEQGQQLNTLRADLEGLRIGNSDLVATNKQLLAKIEQLKMAKIETANKTVIK